MYPDETNVLKRLQRTLDWVWDNPHSDLYQNYWQQHGVSKKPILTSLDDLAQLPIIEKTDMLRYEKPHDRLYIPETEVSFLASTSGSTSGQPFFIWRNCAGNSYYKKLVAEGAKRALLLWTSYGARPVNTAKLTQIGLQVINIDPHQMSDALSVSAQAEIDTLITSPSLALQFAQQTTDHTILERVAFIVFWGEAITPATAAVLQERFPNAALCNGYASAETYGVTIYNTGRCDGPTTLGHVNTDETYVEIVDNAIVLTTLELPHATPLVRFKMGDHGTWHTTLCPCGDPNPRVAILGREGVDYVRFSGLELQIARLDASFAKYTADITPALSVTVTQRMEHQAPIADIHIVVQQQANSSYSKYELTAMLSDALLLTPVSARLTILDAIEKKLITKPTISVANPDITTNKNKKITLLTA